MALKCSIERDIFYEGLNHLQNVTSKKSTMVILYNILIETGTNELVLTATDGEIALRITIPAEIKEQGSITIPAKKIFEIVRESGPDPISIEEKENSWVHILTGRSTYNLAGMPADEFPQFPSFDNDNLSNLESFIFQELIDKTFFSIAGEQENVYTLTSVLLKKEQRNGKTLLTMVSSDGHRLSLMEKEIAGDLQSLQLEETTLIPRKGIQEWKKFCDLHDTVDIAVQQKKLIIKDQDAILVIRLKDGEFPNYHAIIQAVNTSFHMKANRRLFLDALKRINLFTEDVFNTISFQLGDKTMVLSSQNGDLGNARDEMSVDYSGDPLKLGFNCRYFIETLQVMDGETLEVYVSSEATPCMIKSEEDEGFISIIMPMQL